MKKYIQVLFFIGFVSCSNNHQIPELAMAKFMERREEFISNRIIECSRLVMAKAESMADSIMIGVSKSIKYDSLKIPIDTLKPMNPNILFPDYKKPIKPEKD